MHPPSRRSTDGGTANGQHHTLGNLARLTGGRTTEDDALRLGKFRLAVALCRETEVENLDPQRAATRDGEAHCAAGLDQSSSLPDSSNSL